VDSLDLSGLVAHCLLRHLRSRTSAPSAELPFVGALGEAASKVTVMAVLKQGAVLERLAEQLHVSARRLALERREHAGTSAPSSGASAAPSSGPTAGLHGLRAAHPLHLHRVEHHEADLAVQPPLDRPTLQYLFASVPDDAEALKRMLAEHTERVDAGVRFDSPELSEPTFSACEFYFVHDPLGGLRKLKLREWPGAIVHAPRPAAGTGRSSSSSAAALSSARKLARKPKPWSALEPAVRVVNERLARLAIGPLTMAERTAARLFTGPMHLKYDALIKFATRWAHVREPPVLDVLDVDRA
jgi:hypothetical protein